MEAIHAVVTGRVQGVFFRSTTAELGRHLGLDGWVRNLPSGAVEVWAQGAPDAIGRMRTFLDTGPGGASVAGVHLEPVDPDPGVAGFSIRP